MIFAPLTAFGVLEESAGSRARIFSAAYSAAVTIMAEGFPVTMPGKIDPSTTKRLSVP